jgi:MFS family permease
MSWQPPLGSPTSSRLTRLLVVAALFGMFFFLTLYQQQVRGYSAIQAGVAQVPLGLVLIGLAGAAGPIIERLGVKRTLTIGLTLFAGGIAWLAQITVHSSYLAGVLGPSLIIGAGLALAFVALTVASSTGVDEDHHGTAGGLINMTQQIGGALGLAIATAAATSHTHAHTTDLFALTNGFRSALLVSASIAAAATLATLTVLPSSKRLRVGVAAAPAH